MSNYFEVKTRHPREHVEAVIGRKSNPSLAAKIKRENPTLYAELKADGQALGLIALDAHQQFVAEHGPKAPKQLTPEELEALAAVSKEETDRLYRGASQGSKNTLVTLKETDPERARLARIAAIARGTIADVPARPEPKPAVPLVEEIVTPKTLCDHYGLPEGWKTSPAGLVALTEGFQRHQKEEAEKLAVQQEPPTK